MPPGGHLTSRGVRGSAWITRRIATPPPWTSTRTGTRASGWTWCAPTGRPTASSGRTCPARARSSRSPIWRRGRPGRASSTSTRASRRWTRRAPRCTRLLAADADLLGGAGARRAPRRGVQRALARAHERHPQRLVGLATLPLQAPDRAVREVERARALPGVRGFYAATEVLGKELSDPSFFPVYERIEASGLPLFLHPVFVIGHQRLAAHYLTNLLGNPFETAIAAAYLVFGGVLDRFPRLDVVLPHAGGAFPWLVGRLNRGWEKRADLKHIAHPPLEYLRRFHYDTIGYSDAVLEFLVRHVGADRVVMGSDYCFPIAYEQPVTNVTGNSLIDEAAKALIVEGNARRLLRL
ncbi:MAG: amidohydrolase family protein [Burkholderiales bacterium]